MMDHVAKLMEKLKKNGKHLDPVEAAAKMHVMKDLHGQASDAMMDGLKKVTVASDSKEGLAHGLDKAKDILAHAPDMEEDHGDEAPEKMENPDADADAELGEEVEHAVEEHEAANPEAEAMEHGEDAEEEEADHSPEEQDENDLEDDNKYRHMDEAELDKHLAALTKHKEARKARK